MPEEAPLYDGRFVTYAGRTMFRAAGGENVSEDTPPEVPETPAPETGTSEPEAPQYFEDKFDPATLSDELRPAYNQMRGAFTQKTQSLAEERKTLETQRQEADAWRQWGEALQNPETRAQALTALGLEPDTPDTYQEQDNPLLSRLEGLEQRIAERDQQFEAAQKQEQEALYLGQQLKQLVDDTGRDLSEQEVTAILTFADRHRDDKGQPNVREAYEYLTDLYSKHFNSVVGKKTAPRVQTGRPGAPKPNLNNERERQELLAEIASQE